jgi:hypothetical protein
MKNPSQKRAGRVAQGEGPEFKPQYCKKKKKKKCHFIGHIMTDFFQEGYLLCLGLAFPFGCFCFSA